MNVENLPNDPRWKKTMVCDCQGKPDICNHCKFTRQENSIPKNDFSYTDPDGNVINVTKVKVVLGKYDEIIGWTY